MPQSAHRTQNTMSINTLRSLIVHSMLFAVATASSCYDGVGDPQDLEICVPSAAVSACCGTPDYCLSNGLCFNAGVNNLLANQGCTDKNWGSPCHNYCKCTMHRLQFLKPPVASQVESLIVQSWPWLRDLRHKFNAMH